MFEIVINYTIYFFIDLPVILSIFSIVKVLEVIENIFNLDIFNSIY